MLKSVVLTLIGMKFCHLFFTTITEHREVCVEVTNDCKSSSLQSSAESQRAVLQSAILK